MDSIQASVETLNLAHHERAWFRGCSHSHHELLPSLFRTTTLKRAYAHCRTPRTLSLQNPDEIIRLESDLFFDFQMRLHRERLECKSAWDLLFLMRHYGFPTRTLDWTESIGVALHFALSSQEEDSSPTIWLLNPHDLNCLNTSQRDTILPRYIGALSLESPDVDYDVLLAEYQYDGTGLFKSAALRHDGKKDRGGRCTTALAICPEMSNSRMQAQAGTFTVHRDDWRPLEQQIDTNSLIKFTLSPDAILGARLFLREAGLLTRAVFPGIDGLAAEMKSRF